METKSNYNSPQVQLDNEGSIIEKILTEVKQLIFRIVSLMLKIESQSLVLQLILRLIQYMQFNTILFNRQIWRVWQINSVSKPLHTFFRYHFKLFSYFIITPYFDYDSFSYFVIVMYVCIAFLMFALMLICLTGYSMNRQNQNFTWGIALLRILVELFLTILFLPFVDVFISMLACAPDNSGALQHMLFDVQCWSNIHIVHGIVAIFALIVFIILVLLFSMIYYEANYLPQKYNSKKQSKSTTIMLFYIFIMVICYTFMNNKMYDYLHIILMLAGSFLVFWKIHVEKPYNCYIIQKSYSMMVTFHLWGVSMICFAKYLEGVLFFGVIYAWMGGIPLIIITLLRPQKDNYEVLMINLATCQQPEQIYEMTNYIQQLIFESENDQTAGLVIDGYLDLHSKTCLRDDCHLKLKNLPNYRGHKFALKNTNMSERLTDITITLLQIYLNQTKKFPNNIKLRLRYALYMFEKMKQKSHALTEFQAIEQLYPKFDEEFIIFRFKKIVEEEITHNDNYGNFDIGNEIQFQNNFKAFQSIIEKVALFHMDFWSLLQEDLPDLGKLNEIGQKINSSIASIEDVWKQMQRFSLNLPKALRLYGKFLIEVLHDKDLGEELLEKSRQIQQQANQSRGKVTQILSAEDITFEPLPTIIISTAVDTFSSIVNINKACCNVLAYNKTELINKKVTMIMPSMFAKFHDKCVERMAFQSGSANHNFVEKYVFILQKHNYITPSYLNLKVLSTYDDSQLIIGQFKFVKQFKPICFLITDLDKIIEAISSSCYLFLGIDHKLISHNKLNITDLFPSFNDNLIQYQSKQGGFIKYHSQMGQSKGSVVGLSQDQTDRLKSETQPLTFICNILDVKDNEYKLQGYIIRLELYQNEKTSATQITNSLMVTVEKQNDQQPQYNQMQFKLNPKTMTYVLEMSNEANSQRVDQSILWDQQDQSSMVSSNVGQEFQKPSTEKSDDNMFTPTMKLDEGIKTLRLYENKIQDIDDKDAAMSEDEDSGRSSVFQKIDNDAVEVGANDNMNAFRSRTNLAQLINTQDTPKVISLLSWTNNLQNLGIVVLSFVFYFLTIQQYNSIYDQLQLVSSVSIRNAEFFNLLVASQNLQMLNLGIWSFSSVSEAANYEKSQRKLINDTINTIIDLNRIITLNNGFENAQLVEINTQSVITMQVSAGVFQKFDMIQAMEQIISKAMSIRDKSLELMTPSDGDFLFLVYNSINDFTFKMQNATQQYTIGLGQKTTDNRQELQSILGISAGILGTSLILLVFFLFRMAQQQQDTLILFLDIPDKTVKYLYSKSENFLSNIQIGEDEDMLSDLDEVEKEEQEELNRTLKQRRKKKKYKNSNKALRNLILIVLILTMLFQGYFILFYFLGDSMLTTLNQLVPEINVTSYCEGYYKLIEAAERHLFMNREIPLVFVDPYLAVKGAIDLIYEIDASFHQEHSLNVGILNQVYVDAFQNIFMLQPCQIFVDEMNTGTEAQCIAFAQGAIEQGMAVGLARFIESIRYLVTIYDQFYDHPEADFDSIVRGNVVFRNITQNSDNVTNYIYNINNFVQALELRVMQSTYLRATYRYLFSKLVEGINLDLSNSKAQLLALFIVFEAVLFILFFLTWLPLTIKLTRDIWKTRSMIMMIPLKVMLRIRSIRTYVKEVILQKAIEN